MTDATPRVARGRRPARHWCPRVHEISAGAAGPAAWAATTPMSPIRSLNGYLQRSVNFAHPRRQRWEHRVDARNHAEPRAFAEASYARLVNFPTLRRAMERALHRRIGSSAVGWSTDDDLARAQPGVRAVIDAALIGEPPGVSPRSNSWTKAWSPAAARRLVQLMVTWIAGRRRSPPDADARRRCGVRSRAQIRAMTCAARRRRCRSS
jgi:hypothetical protein